MEQFNLGTIEKSLLIDDYELHGKLPWLEDSYRDPGAFFSSLQDSHDRLFGYSGKSVPFKRYDFYYDIIEKNRKNHLKALVWFESESLVHEMTYPELGNRVDALATVFKNAGVSNGQRVCIIRNFGPEFVVSLLASLKSGAVVTCLPATAPAMIKQCLKHLNPDHISTDAVYLPLVSDWQDRVISTNSGDGTSDREPQRSFPYPSGTAVAMLLNLSGDTPFTPVSVSCDDIYLNAMRDGLITLGLRPGDSVSAPGIDMIEVQPSLILSVLMAGGTYIHIPGDIAENTPEVMARHPASVIGVTQRLRDTLLENPKDVFGKCRFWFRDPSGPLDFDTWYRFIKTLGLENVHAGTLKWNSALGGCLLSSRRRKGQALQNVFPSAGMRWHLADPSGGEGEPTTGFGSLIVESVDGLSQGDVKTTPYILAATMGEWMYSASRLPGKSGRFYPVNEVMEIVHSVRFCRYAVMISRPITGSGDGVSFELIVFTGRDSEADCAAISHDVRAVIGLELGDVYLPDTIKCYPLLPKFDDDFRVDETWCDYQYISGGLATKSSDTLFIGLTAIKEFIMRS